jgi:tRNA 2-thiocytidine biosynthesis protein TtcA
VNVERLIDRRVGAALRRHRMIEDGDRVLIAVSGGVDSSVLARVLAGKRGRLPVGFDLLGVHVATDLQPPCPESEDRLDRFFEGLGVPLVRRRVPVLARLEPGGRGFSCFFCAMQRRKAVLATAADLGCGKVAYGHHLDDVIETLLLNLFYNAEISTMPARLELDDHEQVIVRPLCRCPESEIKRYAARFGIEDAFPPCPHGSDGRRAAMKRVVSGLAAADPRIRDNALAALERVKVDYLLEKTRGEGPRRRRRHAPSTK